MDIEFTFLLECVLLQQQLQILSRNVIIKPRGRPLKYITDKERKEAIKNGRKNGRKEAIKNGRKMRRNKYKNSKRENICQ
jgi:hypothetical protein